MKYITTQQANLQWDAVTHLENGDPIPESNTIIYKVYLKYSDDRIELGGETSGLNMIISAIHPESIPAGEYSVVVAGVLAMRLIGDQVVGVSEIAWSNVDAPEPFAYSSEQNPAKVSNLRIMEV